LQKVAVSAYFVAHGGYRRPAEPATLACDGSRPEQKDANTGPLLPKNGPKLLTMTSH